MVTTRRMTKMLKEESYTPPPSANTMQSSYQATKLLVPNPSSVSNVFLLVLLHVCRSILFYKTYLRLAMYGVGLFAVSSITDHFPFPRLYFALPSNILNVYFVKWGWLWTLTLSVPFVYITSYTYCCGNKDKICRHLYRLLVATAFWYFWTNMYVYIEGIYGQCSDKKSLVKWECLQEAGRWMGFDLSGHAFILIYSNLVLIEEMKPFLGWEDLRNVIYSEAHARDNKITSTGPLRGLNPQEFQILNLAYHNYTPYIRTLFVAVTCLTLIWDLMLLSTILYFHSMPEKLASGLIAVITWFLTYHVWYANSNNLLPSPGVGAFKYAPEEVTKMEEIKGRRRSSIPNG